MSAEEVKDVALRLSKEIEATYQQAQWQYAHLMHFMELADALLRLRKDMQKIMFMKVKCDGIIESYKPREEKN